jgi:transposase
VVAPSLIPRKPGDRVKTNRRDAVSLARLLRAGELTAVWVPDEGHEAMRDLVRARAAAVETLGVHRQQVSAFMLKHGRVYLHKKRWTMRYLRWLQEQKFDHPAHQIALQEMVEGVRIAKERVERLARERDRGIRAGLVLGADCSGAPDFTRQRYDRRRHVRHRGWRRAAV